MATIFTKDLSNITTIPGRDTTFSVEVSSDFTATYLYQWRLGTFDITGATNSSYFIDPLMTDNNKVFSVSVSALNSGILADEIVSEECLLTVQEDAPPFDKFDEGKETGRERHRRLRLLGYI